MRVEVRESGENNPADGAEHASPEEFRDPPDLRNPSVKQKYSDEHDSDRDERRSASDPADLQSSKEWQLHAPVVCSVLLLESRQQVRRVSGKPDCTRRNGKRRAKRKLPDKEERDELSKTPRTVNLT